jgi:hypothetical protein
MNKGRRSDAVFFAKFLDGDIEPVADDYALGNSSFDAQTLKSFRLRGRDPRHHLNFVAFYHGVDFQSTTLIEQVVIHD